MFELVLVFVQKLELSSQLDVVVLELEELEQVLLELLLVLVLLELLVLVLLERLVLVLLELLAQELASQVFIIKLVN